MPPILAALRATALRVLLLSEAFPAVSVGSTCDVLLLEGFKSLLNVSVGSTCDVLLLEGSKLFLIASVGSTCDVLLLEGSKLFLIVSVGSTCDALVSEGFVSVVLTLFVTRLELNVASAADGDKLLVDWITNV